MTRAAMLATLAVLAAAIVPAAAEARPPRIIEPPEVSDTTPETGNTLTAVGADWSPKGRDTDVSWTWWRCDESTFDDDDCDRIEGANSINYTVREADEGHRLAVVLFVRNDDGFAWASSAPTSTVSAPAPPPPPPDPTPEPEPSPQPSPDPVPAPGPGTGGTAAPVTAPTGGVLDQTATSRPLRMMRPAPLVRIRGRVTPKGARITLLTVSAPKGARIALRCRGRSCPARRWGRIAATVRVLRFERRLRAGTRLTITVTQPGRIGKHTVILIRRGRAPRRIDRCLVPGSARPRACPGTATATERR